VSHDALYRDVAGEVLRLLPVAGRPLLVGIAGPVSVGKSTTAAILRDLLAERGVASDVLCTDCFLHANTVLAARELTFRKGFPETFDADEMAACLRRLQVPVYSHAVYDVVPGERTAVGDAEVVIVEGVNALQPPAAELYDVSVYVDADEDVVRGWFVDRFLELCAAAGEASFYRMFAGASPEARTAIAHSAWDGINGPNLREHIEPTRRHATFVLRKAPDHSVIELVAPAPPP
jgi:type I pantothenate kinase